MVLGITPSTKFVYSLKWMGKPIHFATYVVFNYTLFFRI